MGGSIWISDIHGSSVDDEDAYFSYSYSGFHGMKGDILKASIALLSSIETDVKEKFKDNPDGARQFLLDAGIKAVQEDDDEQALVKGKAAIPSAVRLLKGWVRTKTGGGSSNLHGRPDLVMGGDLLSMLMGGGGMGGANIDDILDNSYNSTVIDAIRNCPLELERVGMRALFVLMKMPDNGVRIFPEEAKMLAGLVERVIPSLRTSADGGEGVKEMCDEFRGVLLKCVEGKVIKG